MSRTSEREHSESKGSERTSSGRQRTEQRTSERKGGGRPGAALVTGASAGIGRELAWVFAEHGFELVLVARSADRLAELADEIRKAHGCRVTVLPRDLLAPGAAHAVLEAVRASGAEVEVLVNDAGVMELGAFRAMELEVLERMVELNARVLVAMTRLVLPSMLARRRGRILNVASAAAFQPIPSMAVYAATKAFVLSLTEALSEEVRGTGVTVTALCPGLTRTAMVRRAQEHNENASLFPEALMADAAEVARAGYTACMAGRVIEVPGLVNRMLTDWSRLQPRWIVRLLGGLIGRRFTDSNGG
jgi:short-subunit dehydrogenase